MPAQVQTCTAGLLRPCGRTRPMLFFMVYNPPLPLFGGVSRYVLRATASALRLEEFQRSTEAG